MYHGSFAYPWEEPVGRGAPTSPAAMTLEVVAKVRMDLVRVVLSIVYDLWCCGEGWKGTYGRSLVGTRMITELGRAWHSGHGWSVRQAIIDGHVMAQIVIPVWIGILGR